MYHYLLFITTSLLLAHYQLAAYGLSDPSEAASLLAIKDKIGDVLNKLSNWVGDDACAKWTGVHCSTIDGVQYVHELRLLNMNFTGTLAPDVGNLTHLTILNFMWNKLTGQVPPEIGKLSNLFLLLFDGNDFTGALPLELGNLSKLNRLQIDGNNLTGLLPPSFRGLTAAKHIHLNNNSLSGKIPMEFGQLPNLLHLLLDNNNLSGELPPELSNISPLVILQLDNNNFSGGIPSSYTNLLNLTKLSLRNCNLNGTIPNLSSLAHLQYLDLSQNHFSGSLPALSSATRSLMTTIDLSFNNLDGVVPLDYLRMLNLEFLLLQNNSLNGTIAVNQMTHDVFTSPNSVLIVNLQNNFFSEFIPGVYSSVSNVTFRLYGNPVCSNVASGNVPAKFCLENTGSDFNFSTISAAIQVPVQCSENTCDIDHNQELVSGLLPLGQCLCAYPLVVGYRLKSPSFTIFPPHESAFNNWVASGLHIEDYQIHVKEVTLEPGPRLRMTIKLFPSNNTHQFNASEVEYLYSVFSNWSAPANNTFGPYELLYFTIGYPYDGFLSNGNSLSGGAIAGILVAAVALTAIVVAAIMILVGKRQRLHGVTTKSVRQNERIKVAGVRSFSFQELAKATNKFDISMVLGQGGYGKVYKAVLGDGLVVAIKRAEDGSLQGFKEFFTEIDLLSRVHHRNLVSLIGFCDDEGEQMLVYEFMANGTLRDHLNSGSKVPLDFPTRLQIALGAAKGILYLHTEANPPIYHRDIKASNILLDEKRRAKVADFGLSKLAPLGDLEGDAGGHVSTMVKGTPGYLDPEYFYTHQLTDKSDVYSFGVVLLELVTGRTPIYHGKNLVREVTQAFEGGNVLSMVDSRMGMYSTKCILPLIQLAISCCQDEMEPRPSIAEVVRILVSIWQSIPMVDSTKTFSEASMDIDLKQQLSPPLSNPYISSDAGESRLFSGASLQLAPR